MFCCGLGLFLYHFIIIVFLFIIAILLAQVSWWMEKVVFQMLKLRVILCWMLNFHLHVAKRVLIILFLEINELVLYLKTRYPINIYCYSGSPK